MDNSDDEELDDPDGEMDDERDKFEDEVEFALLLNVFPQIHFFSITEDMFAGRAKWDDGTVLRDPKTYYCATLSSSWMILN